MPKTNINKSIREHTDSETEIKQKENTLAMLQLIQQGEQEIETGHIIDCSIAFDEVRKQLGL